jgi:hypothetical protein
MDLQEVGWWSMDWIELARDKDKMADICECGNKHSGFMKCWEFLDWPKTG